MLGSLARWLALGLGAVLVALGVGCMMVRSAGHDPARWHADPLTAERTGKPNDFLVAPEGLAAAAPDRILPALNEPPGALLDRLHAIALDEPRTAVVAGAPEEGHVTYVQRSALFGFPDYVSVRALETPAGTALAIWSRARYGYSDLGVNRARVERWLAALGID